MPRVAAAFFATGALCILVGGAIGMYMAASRDDAFASFHVHMNLVGWATMALCGTFYALTRDTLQPRVAWTNYVVLTAGIVVFFPAFALFLENGNDPKFVPFMETGNGLTGLGMLILTYSAFRELFRKRG